MKSLGIAALFASAIAGTMIAQRGDGTGTRDPAEAVRAQCALYLHFDYDRVRCVEIYQEQQVAKGAHH